MILKTAATAIGITEGQLKIGIGILLLVIYSSFIWWTAQTVLESKYLAEQQDAIEKELRDHNDDAESIREVEIVVEEKEKIVEKVVYETVTKTIEAECPDGAAELTGLLNPLVEETNDQLQF
jgi:hypothetical protein